MGASSTAKLTMENSCRDPKPIEDSKIRRAVSSDGDHSRSGSLSLSFPKRTVLHQLLFVIASFEQSPIQPR
jgi:hypothetical protein